ncbi:substrate-binding periplasmic protein [Nitratidesulfovibrio termitidis]|uniref:substrate-binding periplasmic protein n=1 Tax=Nitratidesulfovibrio termitidis TaxID=42252 RepID=UPI001FE0295F|nr:transporter substrate-binding domain-containing protein [Nitratidesulfovibrio termitidis]
MLLARACARALRTCLTVLPHCAMLSLRAVLCVWAVLCVCIVCPPPADAFTLLTEDLPPFNFVQDNAARGPGVDIVMEVLRRNGLGASPGDIRVLPWPRAFQLALNTPDALLFCAARTPEREKLFKWVGPVMRVTVGTVVRKNSRLSPRKWRDLQGLRVGTVRNTVGEQLLIEQGVPSAMLHAATTPGDAVRMLVAGRVDVLAFNIHSTLYMMEQGNIDSAEYTVSMVLQKLDLYMAFNPDVDSALLDRLQSTLDALRCNGGSPGASDFARMVQPYSPYFPSGSFPEERNCPHLRPADPELPHQALRLPIDNPIYTMYSILRFNYKLGSSQMPFFIPAFAVAGGVCLVVWGAKKIFHNDDSADQLTAKFVASLPAHLGKHVKRVSIDKDKGISIDFNDNTPEDAKKEIRDNIKPPLE